MKKKRECNKGRERQELVRLRKKVSVLAMDLREVFTEKMTFKQNSEGSKGKPCRYLERVLLAEGSMSVKDLMWDLTSWNMGLIMSILFLVSPLIGFDAQSPLWLYFIGPIHETLKERSFFTASFRSS